MFFYFIFVVKQSLKKAYLSVNQKNMYIIIPHTYIQSDPLVTHLYKKNVKKFFYIIYYSKI